MRRKSLFHLGELEGKRELGLSEGAMARRLETIRPSADPSQTKSLGVASFLAVGARGAEDRPWAGFVFGKPASSPRPSATSLRARSLPRPPARSLTFATSRGWVRRAASSWQRAMAEVAWGRPRNPVRRLGRPPSSHGQDRAQGNAANESKRRLRFRVRDSRYGKSDVVGSKSALPKEAPLSETTRELGSYELVTN